MFLKVNRYAGACTLCGARVEPEAGFLQRSREGAWQALCRSCVREHGRVAPLVSGRGDCLVRTGRSVATGRSHDLATCDGCGAIVAYLRSSRGRWYLANTHPKVRGSDEDTSDAIRVYDFQPHDCVSFLTRRASSRIEAARAALRAAEDRVYRTIFELAADDRDLEIALIRAYTSGRRT